MVDFHRACSRRTFITTTALSGGVFFTFKQLSFASQLANSFDSATPSPSTPVSEWGSIPGRAAYRYDGLAKVMGQKIFSRDFSTSDFPHWPQHEMQALVVRASSVGSAFQGIQLEHIPQALRPLTVVTDQDLLRYQIKVPAFFAPRLFCRWHTSPDYLGQPLALLLFDSLDVFLEAKALYRDTTPLVKWGKKIAPEPLPPYCEGRLIRYLDAQGGPSYSPFTHGGLLLDLHARTGAESERIKHATKFATRIQEDQVQKKWRVFEKAFSTQTVDPCFMEPENGLCYFDEKNGKFHIALGTQSPSADGEHIVDLFSATACPIKLREVEVISCFPGGGFGGRDHSMFPLLLTLAGIFAGKNRSVRIIQDRFSQFQSGIKRHASSTNLKIAVDAEGNMQSLTMKLEMPGGGQNNLSFAVPCDGSTNTASGYFMPRADISFRSFYTTGVPAGSMRGFGSVQVQFAVESLIDEIACTLQQDPLEFRLQNILQPGMTTIMGAVPLNSLRFQDIIHTMQAHPLWKNRKVWRQETADFYYGTGAAVTMMSFGTNQDAVLAEVKINPDGTLLVSTNGIDMGQGTSTTLALTPGKWLGRNADTIQMGVCQAFDRLQLWTKECKDQAEEDRAAKDPKFTLGLSIATIASSSAFAQHHAVREAARILFTSSLLPLANRIWGKEVVADGIAWKDGALSAPGTTPILWHTLVQALYKGGICGVMVHGFYRCGWAQGDFVHQGKTLQVPLDALAFADTEGRYEVKTRSQVSYSPFAMKWRGYGNYNTSGCLTTVEVSKKTGAVRIDSIYSFVECGTVIQKQIVEGQAEGALAMGIGQALYEELPENVSGAGDGTWNFHRYQVPLFQHLPVTNMGVQILDPLEGETESKGVGEVVLLPVAPSIVNAIHDAIGVRFSHLPVTPAHILRALS